MRFQSDWGAAQPTPRSPAGQDGETFHWPQRCAPSVGARNAVNSATKNHSKPYGFQTSIATPPNAGPASEPNP